MNTADVISGGWHRERVVDQQVHRMEVGVQNLSCLEKWSNGAHFLEGVAFQHQAVDRPRSRGAKQWTPFRQKCTSSADSRE